MAGRAPREGARVVATRRRGPVDIAASAQFVHPNLIRSPNPDPSACLESSGIEDAWSDVASFFPSDRLLWSW